ncbi:small acid-soluble spore protein P [Paenibacillus sp. LjRoot153]|uniref:small acid-soluble spore protein P n=1 Tax=Paenibacillus sp. LjRoot153 TaxID=3342270 RepID=UPI003ECF71AB
MSKPKSYSAGDNLVNNGSVKNRNNHGGNQEPLSGSKKVKNQNHSGGHAAEGHGHGGD